MIILFKILFSMVVGSALASVVKRGGEGLLSKRGVAFWFLFWVAALIAVLYPGSTQVLAAYLGIGRGADLVFYSAIITLFYIVFRLHIKLEGLHRDLTKMVRDEALSVTNSSNPSTKI